MTFSLDNAVVYDVEVLPNCFLLTAELFHHDVISTWEISEFKDDRAQLREWFNWLHHNQIPMIGFNNVSYDYAMIHLLWNNPNATYQQIYDKNQAYFESQRKGDKFAHMIWDRDRFTPQVDVFKINHFDNVAKMTSLKALQVNMRSPTVVDSPVVFGQPVTREQIDRDLKPYNIHDVKETKRFAHHCLAALNFRIGLIDTFGVDVMNYDDTKIGERMLIKRIGEDICYDRSSGRRSPRQTPRTKIALADVIFPYIGFKTPEFNRILDYLKQQVLTPDELVTEDRADFGGGNRHNVQVIKTKGVFSGLVANAGGIGFHFGTGGIHGSVTSQRFVASDEWLIRDIDVASLYPSIAIVNTLAPAHLGEVFVSEYAKLPAERKEWQKAKGKKCVEANSLKLSGNGAYGKTNSKYSPLYDPQYTMTVTINGQLMLCMLAEWLMIVPTFQIIQINTDGITYRIHRNYEPQAAQICKQWEAYTKLTLEDVNYRRMWIRDVNSYIAEDFDGNLKQKGAYWHPDPHNYADSISECQPPAWHKDLSNIVSIRAAVAAMVQGVDPETFIRCHTDPFDFMCRVKVDRQSQLYLGGVPIQATTRYYVATDGAALVKVSPPPAGHSVGQWKRAPRVTKAEYDRVMRETGGAWDERVCTKARTTYENVQTGIEAGWKVRECNDARNFSFANIDYSYYVTEANKLII